MIPTPAVTQGSFSSQALEKRLVWYKDIVKANNTVCAFVKAFADIPSSEGDLKVLEAGYILLSSASTLRIDKRRAYCLFPLEGGTWIRAISWSLEGRALSGRLYWTHRPIWIIHWVHLFE